MVLGYTAEGGKEVWPEQPTITYNATATLTNLLTKRDGPTTNAPKSCGLVPLSPHTNSSPHPSAQWISWRN